MHTYLIDMLECPACHGDLEWKISLRQRERIEQAEARCSTCAMVYPVLEGIGLFLTPDLPRHDLWQHADNHLTQYLREHPQVERRLMGSPVDDLAPADLFYRALVLEERREYQAARAIEVRANQGIYTAEYLACWQSQRDYVIARLYEADGPIVDLASGRGYLVMEMQLLPE